jgi:alpha-tubulin suppressor-like RCC1 family protein
MEPGEVPGLSDVDTAVATGISAVLKKDGSVWVWGNNGEGQLGNGRRTAGEEATVPQRVAGVNGAVQLAGALVGRHFMALLRDGPLRAWGNSDWGQIGNGVFGREQAAVTTPKIAGVAKVFAAGNMTIAVGKDGTHWVWGAPNFHGPVWPIAKDTVLPLQVSFEGGK